MAAITAWMPPQGRHKVHIGPSLVRSIKARKMRGSPGAAPNGNGNGTTKRSNIPEREFYAFRYNFKPGSIDGTKPASLEIKRTAENTQVLAEFPGKQLNEVSTYNGSELPAKEVECILIYDEETGQYTLEKLDSFVSLQFERKRSVMPSASSPTTEPSTSSTPSANNHYATPSPSLNSSKGKNKRQDEDDDLERLLLADDDDITTTVIAPISTTRDKNKSKTIPATMLRKEEEEEEEGEEIEIPLQMQLSAKRRPPTEGPSAPSNTDTFRPTKPMPKSSPNNRRPTPPPSALLSQLQTPSSAPKALTGGSGTGTGTSSITPAPKVKSASKQKNKTIPAASDEAAELQRPTKKARVSTSTTTPSITPNTSASRQATLPTQIRTTRVDPPNSKPPTELSLPGKQSTFVVPPAPVSSSVSKKATTAAAPQPPVPLPMTVPPGVSAMITMEEVLGDEEDEEEDWEQVPTVAPEPASVPASHHQEADYEVQLENEIFGSFAEDEGEEIDVNAFEAELNEQMGFGMDDVDDDDEMEDAMEAQNMTAPGSNRQPISLNRLASGMEGTGVEGDSDEDYSSSESESD